MIVRLKAIGSIHQVSPNTVSFAPESPFAVVPQYIRRKLDIDQNSQLWCYIGNAFTPAMDDHLITLATLYPAATKNELIVTYSAVEAFG